MPGIMAIQDFVNKHPKKIAAIFVLPNVPKTLAANGEKFFAFLRRIPLTVLLYKVLETSVYYGLRRLLALGTPFTLAKKHNIPVKTVNDPNAEAFRKELESIACDVVFNLSPTILGAPFLKIPRMGCVNFHGGILPGWGGVGNYFWVLINNLQETGTTAHFMNETIDTGDIIGIKRFPITATDTVHSVNFKNSVICNPLMEDIAEAMERGAIPRQKQEPGAYRTFPTRADIASLRKKRELFTVKDFAKSLFA